MNRLIVLCVLSVSFYVVNATYSLCDSSSGSISDLKVTDCDNTNAYCVLRRNTNVTIEITFTPSKDISDVDAVVHGIIMGVPIPFVLPNPNGCLNSGITCPLKAGETYTYQTSLPVMKKYPKVTVDVKFELKSKTEDMACVLIPSKIQ